MHEGGGVPRVKGYVPDARSHITVDFKARDTTVPMADWAIVGERTHVFISKNTADLAEVLEGMYGLTV